MKKIIKLIPIMAILASVSVANFVNAKNTISFSQYNIIEQQEGIIISYDNTQGTGIVEGGPRKPPVGGEPGGAAGSKLYQFYHPGAQTDFVVGDVVTFLVITMPDGTEIVTGIRK